MNLGSIKQKIKDSLSQSADKMLSAKVKDELGLNQPTLDRLQVLSQNTGEDLESDLNTFYKPVNSTFLSTKDYKNIQTWAVVLIVSLVAFLIFLFSSLIIPKKDYSNSLDNTQIIVNGNNINPEKEVIEESAEEDIEVNEEANEELQIENITLGSTSAEKLAQTSPLLQSNKVTLIEYQIRSGDSLEKIAKKFYGSYDPMYVEKIKTANKIRNVRLLQIGQTIIVPM